MEESESSHNFQQSIYLVSFCLMHAFPCVYIIAISSYTLLKYKICIVVHTYTPLLLYHLPHCLSKRKGEDPEINTLVY